MRAVWSWLMEMVDVDPNGVGRDVSAEEGARALTAAGLEIEAVEHIGAGFAGVVVAEVAAKRKHPDADKLTLVDLVTRRGGLSTEVVCGAPNVPEPGGRVLWAAPGATLPGGMEIGTKKLKGVVSAGMICSERELGLGEDHDGIIVLGAADAGVELGAEAATALRLRDVVFEVNVPANRPDCLGHLGLARELAAAIGGTFRPLAVDLAPVTGELDAAVLITVDTQDTEACPRYIARVIDGVTVRPSPEWMKQRLRAVGVRPLSNLIDITNYVMFELGQPLHAFDYPSVAGARIEVRRARAGERMKTLDEVERVLESTDLLICDADRPVALAGVMGGLDSEVTGGTTRVLLEAANFQPLVVRRTARRLGLHSESSHRFERHVDPEVADLASRRAAWLLAELAGGRVARGAVDVYPVPAVARSVRVRARRASSLTGVELSRDRVAELLGLLGLQSSTLDEDTLAVTCPSSRPDLEREVDLIEEAIRLHGFDKVPATLPISPIAPRRIASPHARLARRALTAAGLSEAITFGFTSPARIAALRLPADDVRATPVALVNPMSAEQSVMRTALLPNLLAAVARNLKFDVPDVALFEVGSVFLPRAGQALPDEPRHVAGVLAGRRSGWLKPGEPVDFFDAKGVVERLLADVLGAAADAVEFVAASDVPYLHPGLTAELRLGDGTRIGEVGEVHPATREAFEVPVPCFAFEIDLSRVPAPAPAQMAPITRYPAVTRDISFFVALEVPAARVRALIETAAEPLIERIQVLEDYRDREKVPTGQKGMLWSITYRAGDRTLTDAEVDQAHEAIVGRLLADLPAERR